MNFEYTFGRSVDVDGDEWIDLGSLPTPGHVLRDDDDDNNPFSPPKVLAMSESTATLEPMSDPEPELEPSAIVDTQQKTQPQKPEKKVLNVSEVKASSLPIPAPMQTHMSKAARSKEALMAFYLGRAKQMEAKHKKIVVSPTKPVTIRSLQESERSAPIGI